MPIPSVRVDGRMAIGVLLVQGYRFPRGNQESSSKEHRDAMILITGQHCSLARPFHLPHRILPLDWDIVGRAR